MLGDHFKYPSHQQKAQKRKNMALNRLRKGLCSLRAETWKQCTTLLTFGWEHAHQANWDLSLLCTRLWMTTEAPELLTLGLQISCSEYAHLQNTESMNNEDQLCGMRTTLALTFFFFFFNKLLQGNQTADEKKGFLHNRVLASKWRRNDSHFCNYWNNVHRQQSSMAAKAIKCKAGG